jgi:hypothetical protein
MKIFLLFALLAGSLYYYQGSPKPAATATDAVNTVSQSASNRVAAKEIVVVPAPSYRDRWKTACTDLKTGPNAQVTFEPFLPNEQANWNQTPGYTIVAGAGVRPH